MINSEEMVFVVDEQNNPIDPQPRSIAHKNGLWHRTTGIWAINTKQEILCQKRSLKKDIKPGFWEAFFGGHVAQNEEYQHNAVSEASEELGIEVNEGDLIPYKVFKSDKPTHREFQQVFALKLNKDLSELQFEKEEIDELKWLSLTKVREILVVRKDTGWVIKPWDDEVLSWLSDL